MQTIVGVASHRLFDLPSERATQSQPFTRSQFHRIVDDAKNSVDVLQKAVSNSPGASQNAAALKTASSNLNSIKFHNALPGEFKHMGEALERIKQGESAASVAREFGVSPCDGRLCTLWKGQKLR